MELNDLIKIDTKQMFKTYDDWPNIARESFEEEFKKIDVKDIDHVVFAGMGGSGSIGDTIEAILSKKNIHVSLSKGYLLPKTVDFSRGGGKDVADILGEMDPDDESKYLEAISREAPLLAEEIKKYHLKWDDIFEFFPDNIIRDLMNSVELDLIAMSMKGMDEEVVTRVKNNLPQKKQAMYEPVEGAVSKREVDNARKGIVQAAKQMEKDGAFKLEDFIGGGEMVE